MVRSLGGLVLLAGIGVGLFVYLPAPVNRNTSLDAVQQLAAVRAPQSPLPVSSSLPKVRSFSPPGIALATMAQLEVSVPTRAGSIKMVSPPPLAGLQSNAPSGWQTVVAMSPSSPASQRTSLAPRDPDSRYKLVLDIQQNLKRLGCYYGRIDGSWGAGSKEAMKSFTDSVNATLPIEEPDYLLLTLLQANSGKTCGACPAGLQMSAGGRCVPQTVIAQTRRNDGSQSGADLPWKATVTAAAQRQAKPLFTPVATSVVSSQPLPGRMAIGGPKALPPVDYVYTPPGEGASPEGSPIATAAENAALPPAADVASRSAPPTRRSSSKRSYRSDGPGTPRYNLLLSLGGVY